MRVSLFGGLLVSLAVAVPTVATAASDAEVIALIRSLERRVETLEKENRSYRQQIAVARRSEPKVVATAAAHPPASAQAIDAQAAIYSPNPTPWTGAYLGASAGFGSSHSRIRSYDIAGANGTGAFATFSTESFGQASGSGQVGASIDLFGGYNVQLGANMVVGAQLEGTISNQGFDARGIRILAQNGGVASTGFSSFKPSVDSRWAATALGRLGFLIDPETLIYGLGGWSLAEFQSQNLTDNTFYQPDGRFRSDGWVAGAGIERRVTGGWTIRAEYRYTNFGNRFNADSFINQLNAPPLGSVTQTYARASNFDFALHSARIGFAYSFGN